MNAFQKQLMLGNKCMAELAGQDRDGVGQAIPLAKVSIEEFEKDMKPVFAVHVSPDVSQETLEALAEMGQALIKAIESGDLPAS